MSEAKNPLVGSGASSGAATEKRTLVEEGTTFKGVLTSTCPIFVRGGVEGDIQAPSLTVAASGVVSGKVKAGELKSEGSLAGDFDVDKVTLSGAVKDNTVIRAKSLEVKLAAPNAKMQVVFGDVELEVGDAPSQTKAEPKPADAKADGPANGKSVPPPDAT